VLLIQAAATWQREHGGKLPGSYAERTAFKDLLKSWQRHIDGIPLEVGAVGAGAWQVARVAAATSRQLLAHAVPTSGAQCQPAMPEAVAQLARRPFTCCARPLLAPPPHPPTPHAVPLQEENFTEAVANAHKVWAPPSVSSELRAVLEDPCATNITQQAG
jgi:hypothetical protein